MKKLALLMVLTVLSTSIASADDDDWDDRGYGYYGPTQGNYYPQQQYGGYNQQPYGYYPQQQPSYGYDQRSSRGLAGSVVGDVLGYELGNGNPLISGVGAAAGALLGNGYGMGF
jgi:hypothetical protein